MSVESCIDILYEQVSKVLPITREHYGEILESWDIAPLVVCGKNIGVVMLRNKEIHMHIQPDQALLHARRIIREHLEPNIKKCGHLTTVSFKEPEIVLFLERLGFYKTSEDADFYWYRIDTTKIH